MTGLLSVLPAALRLPMRDILTQLSVDDQVQLALLHREGELGALLALLDAYDANDRDATATLLAGFPGVPVAAMAEILVQSLDWVQSLRSEAP
jgi:EAL and modified HD-GYP domain-containing signal transduction protein